MHHTSDNQVLHVSKKSRVLLHDGVKKGSCHKHFVNRKKFPNSSF
jgi:hypothetical protein